MSSPSNSAANQATKAEKERQAAIRGTQVAVNRIFDDPRRQAEIADYVGAVRQLQTQDLDRQKGAADRELRFALARGGLTGGSTQIDQARRLGEDYTRGALEVDRGARAAGANLEAADQDARARLIQLATSGLDATTAAQQSAAALRSNLAGANPTANALGEVFTNVQPFFKSSRDDAARRRANQDAGWNQYLPSAATSYAYGGKS